MNEEAIFEHLLAIAPQSIDTDGVVTSCLVRNKEIIADAVSAGGEHAEYMLLQKIKDTGIEIMRDDIIYVTLQPCDRRTPGGLGESLGDCTTNVINAGIKNVVYAATYPKSDNSINRFKESDASIHQITNTEIIKKCVELFNSTNADQEKHIPVPVWK
ncbi:MAG: pyrimidine deaminase RibD-like protein [Patiriisocius sp.]|jgi:pyrimidine deaminase RibD-like protein